MPLDSDEFTARDFRAGLAALDFNVVQEFHDTYQKAKNSKDIKALTVQGKLIEIAVKTVVRQEPKQTNHTFNITVSDPRLLEKLVKKPAVEAIDV